MSTDNHLPQPNEYGTTHQSKLIHGQNSRHDVFECSNNELVTMAQENVVSMFQHGADVSPDPNVTWRDCSTGNVTVDSISWNAADYNNNFCNGEFYQQPRAAKCSGTLIAHDLVATAAHCLAVPDQQCRPTRVQIPDCTNRTFGLGYHYLDDQNGHPPLQMRQCQEILLWRFDDDNDYAIVRIATREDGSAFQTQPYYRYNFETPAQIQTRLNQDGVINIATIGNGMGVPLKIDVAQGNDTGPTIRDVVRRKIRTNLDTNGGNSGGPVIDMNTGSMIGIHIAGLGNPPPEECLREGRRDTFDANGGNQSRQQAMVLSVVLAHFCEDFDRREAYPHLCSPELDMTTPQGRAVNALDLLDLVEGTNDCASRGDTTCIQDAFIQYDMDAPLRKRRAITIAMRFRELMDRRVADNGASVPRLIPLVPTHTNTRACSDAFAEIPWYTSASFDWWLDNHWWALPVCAAFERGWLVSDVQGGGRFGDIVNRAEVFTILGRIFERPITEADPRIDFASQGCVDVQTSDWFFNVMADASNIGLHCGQQTSNGRLCLPGEPQTLGLFAQSLVHFCAASDTIIGECRDALGDSEGACR